MSLLWRDYGSLGFLFDEVKSIAMVNFIWQPPKTYYKKLTVGYFVILMTKIVSLLLYRWMGCFVSRSSKVVKTELIYLWLPSV